MATVSREALTGLGHEAGGDAILGCHGFYDVSVGIVGSAEVSWECEPVMVAPERI